MSERQHTKPAQFLDLGGTNEISVALVWICFVLKLDTEKVLVSSQYRRNKQVKPFGA